MDVQVEGAGRRLGVKAPDPLVKRLAVKRLPLGAERYFVEGIVMTGMKN